VLSSACGWAGEVFTKYNLHVQDRLDKAGQHEYTASCANWTDPGNGHLVIPANTGVEILDSTAKVIKLKVVADGKIIKLEFNRKWMMGMTADAYAALITAPVAAPVTAKSAVDRQGIQEGKALVGMTKAGVMTALGYPAAQRTPNPETNKTWIYWTNRFVSMAVEFDEAGLVKSVSR